MQTGSYIQQWLKIAKMVREVIGKGERNIAISKSSLILACSFIHVRLLQPKHIMNVCLINLQKCTSSVFFFFR